QSLLHRVSFDRSDSLCQREKFSPEDRHVSLCVANRVPLTTAIFAVALLSTRAWTATTVTAVAPSLGLLSGGTTVQITGSNFSAGTTVVQFGGTNASSFT